MKVRGEVLMGWFLGIFLTLMLSGFLIALGQQLLWQLRRTDCGVYTVQQYDNGQVPRSCINE